MFVLIVALFASFAVGMAVTFFFGLIPAAVPVLIVFAATYLLVARAVAKRVEAAMMDAVQLLQKNRIEQGLQKLVELKNKYRHMQFFLASAIDGQIGSVYYMRQDFDRAKPYLEKSFVRHWVARGMLGVLYFRKKDFQLMDKTFETALRYSAKQGLLWSVWAFCHFKAGHLERAMEILRKGQAKLGSADPRLNANLLNLQNEKKMKMKAYGEQWYQFMLELPPQMVQAQGGRQVRHMVRR